MLNLLLILETFVLGLVCAKLASEIVQRRQLLRWLRKPNAGQLPDGSGRWRDVFSAQQQLQKQGRREVAELDFRLQRFLRATQVIPDGVVLLDTHDRIEWANIVACKYLGIDITRDLGTLITQLVRQPSFFSYLQGFRADGEQPAESLTLDLGDPLRTVLLTLLKVSDQGTLLMIRDISDSQRTERMRRDFVANVSHELRTPITVISGFLEQLVSDEPPNPEDAARFLKMMAEQSTRMSRLIEDLLTLSRLESETRSVREELVDVPTLVIDLLDEARALSAGRHTVVLGEVAPYQLTGCTDELRSAFSNLITNAIRYTPVGGTITVSWDRLGDQSLLSVTDTGIGLAPEHIPRLTERFYRVDRGRSTATGGTGLGLAIVKHVLSRHDAKLSIQSVLGRGSTFSASFPAFRCVKDSSGD